MKARGWILEPARTERSSVDDVPGRYVHVGLTLRRVSHIMIGVHLTAATRLKMRSRILAKAEHLAEDWTASAFRGDVVPCSVRGVSKDQALENLKARVRHFLDKEGRSYLESWQAARAASPNCPEGAVKLPVDLWICKLVDKTCPIQAQVSLDDPDLFFRHCLASEHRKQQIFDTVETGTYGGFHHVVGRYLCPYCDRENKKVNFRYHYPWELACLETYSSFVFKNDWPHVRSTLKGRGLNPFTAFDGLCAPHSMLVAEALDPVLASHLVILEFDLDRPSPLKPGLGGEEVLSS